MRGLGFRVSDLGFVGLGPRDFASFRGFRLRLSRGLGALSALGFKSERSFGFVWVGGFR